MRRLSLATLFCFSVFGAYLLIGSIRFLPLSYTQGFITSPIGSIKRLYFPELRGTCFNPSIVATDGGYLLSFRWDEPDRCLKNLTKSARWSAKTVRICLVELNHQFIPKSLPQVLSLVDQNGDPIHDPADMRIIRVKDKIVGVFNTANARSTDKAIIRLYSVNFEKEEKSGNYLPSPCHKLIYEDARYDVEKNWTPFVWKNELYLVYEITPHTIIKPDLATGFCQLIEKESFAEDWKFGPLRGGTPAIVSNHLYISFFHSILPAARMTRHHSYYYFMGCYAFAEVPPFQVKAITPAPILPAELYSLRHNHRKILYPSGLTENDEDFIVACGENDEHIVLVTVDKKKLFRELKEIAL